MSGLLAGQQQALVAALWAGDADAAEALAAPHLDPAGPLAALCLRGLQAYRANGRALAVRALEGTYPVVAACLGAENFAPLASRFWRVHPPVRGDLGQWGDGWADFLAAVPGLVADQPLLPDLARLEWALHAASTAADTAPALDTLALLATHPPEALRLALAPGTALVPSSGAVVSAWQSGGDTDGTGAQTALVWREGLAPRVRVAAVGEAVFLGALLAGASLADALAQAPTFDAAAWLAPAAHEGLLLGVRSP